MPETRATKNQFSLAGGLNTEAHELRFPDGFSVDEQNYEIRPNGTRRRRKGLAEESGGAALTPDDTITSTQVHKSVKWRGAGGDPTENYIVHQIGTVLFITDDAETISTTYHAKEIQLQTHLIYEGTTVANLGSTPCSFSVGRGRLFVAHKYCQPFYIEFDVAADTFRSHAIPLSIRDFFGIDDGIGNNANPAGAAVPLTADHQYNLRNRGWKQVDIDAYDTATNTWPAKNQFWFRGYRRQTDVQYSDLDGIQVFDAAKVAGEFFSGQTAGQGALLLNPIDPRFGENLTTGGLPKPIETWSEDPQGNGIWEIDITITSHGLTTSDSISLSGQRAIYKTKSTTVDKGHEATYEWNGSYTVTVINGNTFTITTKAPGGGSAFFHKDLWKNWIDQFEKLGQLDGGDSLPNSSAPQVVPELGPSTIEYHGGHVFYAGLATSKYADTIFFSQTALQPEVYGFCFQAADPTDSEFNALLPNDGGTIVIPNLGVIKEMKSVRGNLLVFSDQGVWEIAGGQRGFFTADGYSVRKITDDECSSEYSPIPISDGAIYTGPKGIFQLAPNEFTGALESTNISAKRIQTLWNEIPAANQKVIQSVYDDALKRVYLLYGQTDDNINIYRNALVIDLRVGAFYKYKFNSGVFTAYSITDSDSSDSNKKVKWTCHVGATIETCDMDQSNFLDFDAVESPLPFIVTGWDNLGDFQRRRSAPVITVFSAKTETGYTDDLNGGLIPVNESSTLMRARWDFADLTVSGKWGSENEVYRHVRNYQPVDENDTFDDGYPVVITRNKVRGRGRVLQLRFEGATAKDSHILGFSINYKISRAT